MKPQRPRQTSSALLVLATALTLGCGKASPPAASAPAGSPAVELAGAHGEAKPAAAPVATITGTVLETMNAAGYTYMKLKTAEGETWAAVNEAKVEVGAAVTVLNPMPMDGFESQTLKKKFDHIVFGTLAPAGGAAPATAGGAPGAMAPPAGMGAAPGMVPESMAAQHAQAATGPEVTEKISVPKAEGAEGRTIAELFAQHDALKGKTVAIRGKVVKFNSGIMGKNWIHLRDGSGTPEAKNHDVTVTTNDTVAKGDVVLVKGVVAVDRDFGAGYTYPLVVEEAKVTK